MLDHGSQPLSTSPNFFPPKLLIPFCPRILSRFLLMLSPLITSLCCLTFQLYFFLLLLQSLCGKCKHLPLFYELYLMHVFMQVETKKNKEVNKEWGCTITFRLMTLILLAYIYDSCLNPLWLIEYCYRT